MNDRSPRPRVLLLLALCLSTIAFAQSPAAEPPPLDASTAAAKSELRPSAAQVEVEAPVADRRIAERLRAILESTGKFETPDVEVRDGVVFLSGRAASEPDRDWAVALAQKTEGVVAVVDRIELADSAPGWSLSPARTALEELRDSLVRHGPLIAIGACLLLAMLLLARLASGLVNRALSGATHSRLARAVARKFAFALVAFVGVYLFLRVSGWSSLATTVLGGSGILGLILGFAFRDIAENFLASILISVQQPFQIGDTIEVDGRIGVVQKVTARGTVLLDYDGNFIQIANATVYKSTIRNLTANRKTRLEFNVGVGYDADIRTTQDLVLGVLRGHSAVLDDPEPMVLVDDLGAAAIRYRVLFWIDVQQHSMLKVRSAVMRVVVSELIAAGVPLPDDAREVLFPKPLDVRVLRDDEITPTRKASTTPKPSARADRRDSTEAEGDLKSEVADLQKQARESRTPEEGEDILEARPGR